MLVRLVVSLCLALTGIVLQASSAAAYTPQPGAIFGNPWGSLSAKYAISSHVNKSIDGTRRGATIMISTFAFDLDTTMYKLIKAHRRGVNVRVLINARGETRQVRRLKRALGTDIRRRSFAKTCLRSCRGRYGELHSKVYMFSQAGAARNVVMISSTNLSHSGAKKGWNDVFTVTGRPGLFAFHTGIFNEMASDVPVRNPYRTYAVARYRSLVFPRPGTTRSTDTMWNVLSGIRCWGARGGAGSGGRTVVRVAMFHWAGERGVYLARKLRSLDNAGCIVKVIVGAPSAKVMYELRLPTRYGGIDLWDSRYDLSGDGIPDRYTHTKQLLVSGNYAGDPSSWNVWTGSPNWAMASLRLGDETILRITGPAAHASYVRNFGNIIRTRTRWVPTLGTSSSFGTQSFLAPNSESYLDAVRRSQADLPKFSSQLPEPE